MAPVHICESFGLAMQLLCSSLLGSRYSGGGGGGGGWISGLSLAGVIMKV